MSNQSDGKTELLIFKCLTFLENVTFTKDFDLGKFLRIRKASKEELDLYERHFKPVMFSKEPEIFDLSNYKYNPPTHVLVSRTVREEGKLDFSSTALELQRFINIAIIALRFCTKGMIGHSGYVYLTPEIETAFEPIEKVPYSPIAIDFSPSIPFPHAVELEVFNVDEKIEQISKVLMELLSFEGPGWDIPFRRFNLSYNEREDEDRIIDLCIAFESLFGIRQELSFRLSIYLANLVGKTQDQRVKVFNFMRTAYKVRSDIVHGVQTKAKDLEALEVRDLHQLYLRLRELFVISIDRIFEMECKTKSQLQDKLDDITLR